MKVCFVFVLCVSVYVCLFFDCSVYVSLLADFPRSGLPYSSHILFCPYLRNILAFPVSLFSFFYIFLFPFLVTYCLSCSTSSRYLIMMFLVSFLNYSIHYRMNIHFCMCIRSLGWTFFFRCFLIIRCIIE
jgi:hypothetical protein